MSKECEKLEQTIYWSNLLDISEAMVLHEKNIENEQKILQNLSRLRDLYLKKQDELGVKLTYLSDKGGKN